MIFRRSAPLAAIIILTLPVACMAGTIYASDGTTLYDIDPNNASVVGSISLATSLSNAGAASLAGLASYGGVLYGDLKLGTSGLQFVTIDPLTGAFTTIGTKNFSVAPGQISFDSGGLLYLSDGASALVKGYNASTGAFVNNYACSSASTALLVGADGRAWLGMSGTTNLRETPLAAGTTCSTGSGAPSGSSGSGTTGTFIATMTVGDGVNLAVKSGASSTLYSFNTAYPAFGIPTFTTVGALPNGISSLADVQTSLSPEPSSLALLAIGLTAWAGFLYNRRRRAL